MVMSGSKLATRRSNARWDPAATSPSGGYRIVLEFYLKTTQALDAKYAEMIGFGYESHSAPSDVSPELRFAMVNDPDGNTILLSASTGDPHRFELHGEVFSVPFATTRNTAGAGFPRPEKPTRGFEPRTPSLGGIRSGLKRPCKLRLYSLHGTV